MVETLTHAKAGPNPFEALSADESRRRLEAALATVPEKYREALVLVCVERFSPQEAAHLRAPCWPSPSVARGRARPASDMTHERTRLAAHRVFDTEAALEDRPVARVFDRVRVRRIEPALLAGSSAYDLLWALRTVSAAAR